jgi:hypothetical protein
MQVRGPVLLWVVLVLVLVLLLLLMGRREGRVQERRLHGEAPGRYLRRVEVRVMRCRRRRRQSGRRCGTVVSS